jgi:hypothetical protein
MDWITFLFPLVTSAFLLVFGAMIAWRGTILIYNFYPQTLQLGAKPSNNENPLMQSLTKALQVQNDELNNLQTNRLELRTQRGADSLNRSEPEKAMDAETRAQEKSIIENSAQIISAIKDLLGANFGPAALLIVSGIVIIGCGIWLLSNVVLA